ncbi:MAG: hypothetical protein DHS20C01_11330 [marine bacterium B5-7]|nr:MAG: hypothetical protein DHS20C01_11330 [marine bacterium B5-7]
MRWKGGRRSSHVEDRRGTSNGGFGFPTGRGRRVRVGRKSAGGGIGFVVLVVAALYFGIDPSILLQGGPSVSVDSGPARQPTEQENQLADFVSVVLADTEDSWNEIFAQQGKDYIEPSLVLFSGAVRSACGLAQSAMGPFYCPGDNKVYIDLSFYDDMRRKFGAPGDFAQAYVIAHEVGHHVQNLLGISDEVHNAQQRVSKVEGNELSVRLELQADCLAGLWAVHADRARDIIEQGDVDEALNAAAAIGDDRLQKQTTGRVSPDSFTHGTSEQRARWFKTGMQGKSINDCNTFSVSRL